MEKRIYFQLATLLLLWQTSISQNFEWVGPISGLGSSQATAITVDDENNVYSTGFFGGTTDFDPGPDMSNLDQFGGFDVYIQKLDSEGNLIWARAVGGASAEDSYGIAVDASGNVYVIGTFLGTADFDPGPGVVELTPVGNWDTFLVKLSADGDFMWVKHFSGPSFVIGSSIGLDAAGNIIVAGYFIDKVDCDPGPGIMELTSYGGSDVFILKLNSIGELEWVKQIGGTDSDLVTSLDIDDAGNIYSSGGFSATADFDPGPDTFNLTSVGLRDIFVQKLDASGNLVWAQGFGSITYDVSFSIAVDVSGNVYSIGNFDGTVDFDPGPDSFELTSNGIRDIYIQKLNSNGDFIWAKTMGGPYGDDGFSIAVDEIGNVYSTGMFQATVDFDPGPDTLNLTASGNSAGNAFIQKLDANGDLVSVKQLFGDGFVAGYSLALDDSRNIYSTGYFYSTVDFDPGAGESNLTAQSSDDAFVLKLSQCTLNTTLEETACDSYTLNNQTYTSSGTYFQNFMTQGGCDSTVILDLNINTADTSVTQDGFTLSANATDASYQWIDCNNNNEPLNGETNQSFMATTAGSYAVIVTQNGCTQASDCYDITSVGTEDNYLFNNISVFPNPSNGNFLIDLKDNYAHTKVIITDIAGKTVFSEEYSHINKAPIFLKGTSGVYFLNIYIKGEIASYKIIKK